MLASNNERRRMPLLSRFFPGLEKAVPSTVVAVFMGFQYAQAADAPERPDFHALSSRGYPLTDKDCQLALFAREALLKDEILGQLNLGVTVHSRVAILWGTVPRVDLARLAEEKVRCVPGLAQVKNELRISAPDDDPAELLRTPPFPSHSTPQDQPKRWSPPTPLVSRGDAFSPWTNKVAEPSPLMMPPIQAPAAPERVVASFSPSTSSPFSGEGGTTKSVLKVSLPLPLIEALDNLRRSNERFRQVRFEVQGGAVHLWGNAANSADVFTLAQQVSRVPGVERVIVERAR